MAFFDDINDKFFNPLSCRNKELYFECITRLIEYSKTVPVLYELDAKDILVLYLQNCIYSIETEGLEDEISGKLTPQENAAIILRYFRECGWIVPVEIGRNGDNIASVTIQCRKLIDAINKIFNADLNGAITNHIFSIHEILKSSFDKDSVRAIRPYTNILLPLIENESDLKNELLVLRDSIRKIMQAVIKFGEANNFGQYLIKDELLNKFFNDYFFIKKSGMIPAYISNIDEMIRKLRHSKLYNRIIDEYISLVDVDVNQAKIIIDKLFDTLSEFINNEYEIEMDYIDRRINSYYNLYSTRMIVVLSNNINLEHELNQILLLLKSMDENARNNMLLHIADAYRLLSIKYIGKKSFEKRRKINPHKAVLGINLCELTEDEKKRLTDEILVELTDSYGVNKVKNYFDKIFVNQKHLNTEDFKIQNRRDAMMLAAGVIYAGSEDFPYEVDIQKEIVETDVASISKMKFERKNYE